ncbi:peptidylprolyl isomerase [Nostoc sp. TCL26-01]|uniref:peptidylprolyl isomerase n=1 Tax=Nostoc sp. TCL26-01 TaxID=2576904 RepID=UPI0015C0A6C0|nr:peptidylprolyl isomerase [Nostoc sp. TCL26-01]QLE59589.1 peptidylprolyl isomerase [Nostoc sp. TCL26-01]
MDSQLQIGDRTILPTELPLLLAQHKILPILQREIIIERAISNISLTPEEKAATIEAFYQQNQLTTPQAVAAVQQQFCINQNQLQALATKELKLEKFKIATWGNKLEQYFLQCKPQLDKVVYCLLRTDNSEVAQELFFRIQDGDATFAECASIYSQGLEAQTGGLIGPVPISQAHPIIAEKLATIPAGQVLPPIKLENWYIIIRLESLIPAQLDDVMKTTLLNHLFEQWLTQEIKNTPISLVSNDHSAEQTQLKPYLS